MLSTGDALAVVSTDDHTPRISDDEDLFWKCTLEEPKERVGRERELEHKLEEELQLEREWQDSVNSTTDVGPRGPWTGPHLPTPETLPLLGDMSLDTEDGSLVGMAGLAGSMLMDSMCSDPLHPPMSDLGSPMPEHSSLGGESPPLPDQTTAMQAVSSNVEPLPFDTWVPPMSLCDDIAVPSDHLTPEASSQSLPTPFASPLPMHRPLACGQRSLSSWGQGWGSATLEGPLRVVPSGPNQTHVPHSLCCQGLNMGPGSALCVWTVLVRYPRLRHPKPNR